MPNRKLLIGASVCVAGLVLLVTVFFGGPRIGGDDAPETPFDPDAVYLPEHTPDTPDTPDDRLPVGEAEGLIYEIRERGILFFADRVVPKPQGVIDVIQTTARINLAPGREMTIDADEGTIVAPDNHPQGGEMRGHVVVTLYEAPDGAEVDFDTDRHVVTRMYFDDPVEFDLELQQIDSVGALFLTGPQVQMRGRGLSLNYNQLRQRIERLVIEEGESLRYIPEPTPQDTPDTPDTPADANAPPAPSAEAGSPAVASDAPARQPKNSSAQTPVAQADDSPATDTDTEPTERAIQYYLATFERLNTVSVAEDQIVMTGDDLAAMFSTKSAGDSREPVSTSASGPLSPWERVRVRADGDGGPGLIAAHENKTSPHPGPLPGGEGVEPDRSRSLASADPVGAAVAYALSVSLGQMPDEDPRSLATFTDQDVVITWDGRLTVTPLSETPEALAGPDDVVVTVKGKPASIRTDKGETLLAAEHAFSSKHARLHSKGAADAPVSITAPDMGTLTGVEVDINQALGTGYVLGPGKLTGKVRESKDDAAPETTQLAPNPQSPTPNPRTIAVAFNDRLNLAFYLKDGKPDTANGPLASSDNRIKGVKTAEFLGDVHVDHDDLAMTADRMMLALLEDAPEGDDKLAVESLTATGRVEADVKTEDVHISADRLVANPALDQLKLFGTADVPASVVRPDATLAGEHLVMDQNAGTVDVLGPGSFTFLPDPQDPGKTIRVTWVTSMRYDDLAGAARFLGDVKTISIDGPDTNELMGDDLAMWFVKDESAGEADDAGDRASGRRLAKATMDGNVRYRARSYATPEHDTDQMQTELYLRGKKMVFTDPGLAVPDIASQIDDEAVQQVSIVGVGSMLITDYREEADTEPPDAGATDAIDMSGRGRTAFQWSDGLDLDLTQGDMLMKGDVVMVHQPEKGEPTRLECRDLAAELKAPPASKQGGDGWLSEDAPQPELDRVWADGGVHLFRGPVTITCDHLLYQESKREVILWSDEPNMVVYEAEGEPTPTRSSALKWNRDTGRVEAFELNTGTVPLRRGERQ